MPISTRTIPKTAKVRALINERRFDYCHRLGQKNIHLTQLEEATRGGDDVEAGELLWVAELKARYKKSSGNFPDKATNAAPLPAYSGKPN